jgi:hypothetical protein
MALKNEKKENRVINIILTPRSPNHRQKERNNSSSKRKHDINDNKKLEPTPVPLQKKEETI